MGRIMLCIPGNDPKDAHDNVSWILRSFLANAATTWQPGSPRRFDAVTLATQTIDSIEDPSERARVAGECGPYLDPHLVLGG